MSNITHKQKKLSINVISPAKALESCSNFNTSKSDWPIFNHNGKNNDTEHNSQSHTRKLGRSRHYTDYSSETSLGWRLRRENIIKKR